MRQSHRATPLAWLHTLHIYAQTVTHARREEWQPKLSIATLISLSFYTGQTIRFLFDYRFAQPSLFTAIDRLS